MKKIKEKREINDPEDSPFIEYQPLDATECLLCADSVEKPS